MSLAYIQIPAFIFYCSPVQGRMGDAGTGVYEFSSVVRGQHIYNSVWLTKCVSASCRKTKGR